MHFQMKFWLGGDDESSDLLFSAESPDEAVHAAIRHLRFVDRNVNVASTVRRFAISSLLIGTIDDEGDCDTRRPSLVWDTYDSDFWEHLDSHDERRVYSEIVVERKKR